MSIHSRTNCRPLLSISRIPNWIRRLEISRPFVVFRITSVTLRERNCNESTTPSLHTLSIHYSLISPSVAVWIFNLNRKFNNNTNKQINKKYADLCPMYSSAMRSVHEILTKYKLKKVYEVKLTVSMVKIIAGVRGWQVGRPPQAPLLRGPRGSGLRSSL
jgi:hypothetical protein